jgi:aminoglycoside phosphotransferase family enzyme
MTGATAYEALQHPDVYPEATSQVEVRETHISWVYLTDQYAYKIKKPFDLWFLDFSTIDQRQQSCEREVALNCRLSTDMYLDVVPLRQSGSAISFDGDDKPARHVREGIECDGL